MTLGLISDRGRSTIMHFSVSVSYSTIALGMIAMVREKQGAGSCAHAHELTFLHEHEVHSCCRHK